MGGTVVVVPVPVTVVDINTGAVVQGARVYLTADTGGPLTAGTVVLNGSTNAPGQASAELDYTASQPFVGCQPTTSTSRSPGR